MLRSRTRISLVALAALAVPTAPRAELIEEIVAWVNGDIITLSEYKSEEEGQTSEAYRQLSGEALDTWIKERKPRILLDMIDRKILVHHAKALGYDLDKLGDSILESFREQQGVGDDTDFERMITEGGMTIEDVKRRLVEMYAPQEVITFEVKNRVAVSEAEIEGYYLEHPAQFTDEGAVTFREIVLLADDDAKRDARRAEAQAIRERIVAGEDFGEVAKRASEAGTRDGGGLLGPLSKDDLSEQLSEVAFSIPVGEVSEILETPYGFHLLEVESRTEDTLRSLEEVHERLRDYLERLATADRMEEFMTRMRDDSEWCVKPKYQHLVPISAPSECETL